MPHDKPETVPLITKNVVVQGKVTHQPKESFRSDTSSHNNSSLSGQESSFEKEIQMLKRNIDKKLNDQFIALCQYMNHAIANDHLNKRP
ncbi:hypothetical protein VA7868_02337 [Vibrio aerogenes CECT 7868]|uniref:Uncharacterized protein n=1 Tax=Vibrio aerogenes CECT 7868 TaxID=1216006 RepID=A0A1M5Z629_9VIBR|nr:hypothetical protein [Vibrio aerogenes]SHI19702.1 hypothetical protein VA7868_02337 [Vibrio aerogenes CECT 7868]